MNQKVVILADSISKVIVGKDNIITNIIAALLCDGHVLLEDVPGVGKTQLASALAFKIFIEREKRLKNEDTSFG